MLAQAETLVVFVLDEKISLGIWEHITADWDLSLKIWLKSWKCHSDVVYKETWRVERGKPHKRETQIW